MSIFQRLWRVMLGVAIGASGCVLGFYLMENLQTPYRFMGAAVAVISVYFAVATMSAVLPGKLR